MSEQRGNETTALDPPAESGIMPGGEHASAVSHASKQEDPSAQAEGLGAEGLGEGATGDIVIDAALQDLAAAQATDLDAQIEAGQRVQQTLQGRLSDLGGE